jgi:hypothetical protein
MVPEPYLAFPAGFRNSDVRRNVAAPAYKVVSIDAAPAGAGAWRRVPTWAGVGA